MSMLTSNHRRVAAAALGAGALAFALSAATGATALGAVDQRQPLADGSVTTNVGVLQTFTVGSAGTLDAVSVTSPSGGPARFQLYKLAPGGALPGTPVIANPISVALMPGVASTIALPTPPTVRPGDVFGIALGPIRSTSSIDLASQSGDPYAAGTLYKVVSVTSFTPVAADLQFSTYVTAPALAPTTLTLATLKSTKGVPTATLTTTATGAPLSGRVITFARVRANGTTAATCSATANAAGVAACAVKWSMPQGGKVTAHYGGDATTAASDATTTS